MLGKIEQSNCLRFFSQFANTLIAIGGKTKQHESKYKFIVSRKVFKYLDKKEKNKH